MPKERISSDIDKNLRIATDAKANALGISRAKLIEISLKSELGRFNVHKENKRLTEAKNNAEQETEALRQQLTTAEAEHKDTCNRLEREKTERTEQRDEFEKLLHAETDVCNRYDEQVKSLKKERAKATENLKQIASHLGVPDTVEHCKQRIDELEESIEDKKRERNHFKAAAEEARTQRDTFKEKFQEAHTKYLTCSEKLTQLMTRTWWERFWNVLPWVE